MGVDRTNKKLKALFVGAFAVALCFALAGCGGSSGSSAASASSASGSASASASAASQSASAAAASASSAAASTSASAASASASAASSDTIDQYGNVTLYAAMELTGPEMTALLEKQQYEWRADSLMWIHPYSGATFASVDKNGGWKQENYAQATEKGAPASVVALNIVGGYENSEKALSGNAHCVIEDSYFNADGTGIAIVYGPSMEEHLVLIRPNSESTTELSIFSKAAVGSGLLDQIYGQPLGGSFNEVWKNITGKDSYGH